MKNYNGFTLIEVLVSFSIVFMVITTILPISTLLEKEENTLSQRRLAANMLHDELQTFLWEDHANLPQAIPKQLSKTKVSLTFMKENDFIKGCAQWQNGKKTTEKLCLYGLPEK